MEQVVKEVLQEREYWDRIRLKGNIGRMRYKRHYKQTKRSVQAFGAFVVNSYGEPTWQDFITRRAE